MMIKPSIKLGIVSLFCFMLVFAFYPGQISNKGLLIEASHGYVTNVTVKNTTAEAFKIRKNSQYWLVSNSTTHSAGQGGKFGEGFYVGDDGVSYGSNLELKNVTAFREP